MPKMNGMSTTPQSQSITVQSPDGVQITGSMRGAGSGLAFVYGALMEQPAWQRLSAQLQSEHLIYTYDRRGRGASTDSDTYAVDHEVEDLLTFVGALPQPLDLFAHSSGALLTLHAVTRGLPVRRLVLYEPPLAAIREPVLPPGLAEEIFSLVAQGERDKALERFMLEGMWLNPEDVERLRGGERWQDQLRYIQTTAYDVRVTRTYELDPARLSQVRIPTLLLYGSNSPEWMKRGMEAFGRALPDARLEVLEDQGHNAMFSNPRLLAEKIRAFLR